MALQQGVPVIFDFTCTGTPTALSPKPLLFTGWITAASTNGSNVTLASSNIATSGLGSGVRVAQQSDFFSIVDLNQILASGSGNKVCVSGSTVINS